MTFDNVQFINNYYKRNINTRNIIVFFFFFKAKCIRATRNYLQINIIFIVHKSQCASLFYYIQYTIGTINSLFLGVSFKIQTLRGFIVYSFTPF